MRNKTLLIVLIIGAMFSAMAEAPSSDGEEKERQFVYEIFGREFEIGENFVPFPNDTVFTLRDLDGRIKQMTLDEFMQSEMSYDYRHVLRMQWTWEQNVIINETGTLEEVLQNPMSQEIPERFRDQVPNYRTRREENENDDE